VWYLAAQEGDTLKSFAFGRIQHLTVSPTLFTPDPLVDDTLAREEGVWLNPDKKEVVLKKIFFEKIKELKKILFNLIKKIDITEPIIDSKDTSIQELSKEIVSLSILTLTHYSNFDAYYTRFPILDYELLNDFSIVTENTFTHEKLFKLKFRLSYLKNLQKYLTYYTFQRKSKNENELLSENKLLLEMMQEDTKILNMRTEISKEAQNKLDQVNKCFSNINEALLRKISLGYYIGFYEHYSKAYYKSESSSSNSFEVNSLISLYHKYVYTGDIFTRRLKNLDESCLQIQKINPKLLEIDSFLSKYSR